MNIVLFYFTLFDKTDKTLSLEFFTVDSAIFIKDFFRLFNFIIVNNEVKMH